jgi:hypothetical protein
VGDFRRFVLLAAALAASARSGAQEQAAADNWLPADPAVAHDAAEVLGSEGSRSAESAWLWGASGAAMAAYSIVAFSGGHGKSGTLKYFSALGALGALIGVSTSVTRARQMSRLRLAVERDLAESGSSPGLRERTVREAGKELRMMHSALITTATSSLRTGCVLPVLLSGIAVFGLASGISSGPDLAGVCLAGGLGIGGPSMLYYLNVKRELPRMNALMRQWNGIFPAEAERKGGL